MPRIKSILGFAAISAATVASATGIAGAVPAVGHSLPWCSIPKADRIAAELAATHTSAPLYQFGLIHVRAILPTTTCKGTEVRSARGWPARLAPATSQASSLDWSSRRAKAAP
jgi:hypothetical protein